MTAAAVGARFLFERNLMVYRRAWMIIFSGFFEPLLYLFSLGFGLKVFVGAVPSPAGGTIDYASFIAPALLGASAMNGAVYDAGNVFWKLRYNRVYDAIVSTPVTAPGVAIGETAWGLFRGLLYCIAFLIVMTTLGLVHSWWGVLALPAAFLTGFAFAGIGVAASTWMRTWQDFEFVQLATLPMFLFSATFFPLSAYPTAIEWFIRVTPLYRAISLLRGLTLGAISWTLLVDVVYLAALGSIGIWLSSRRIHKLLLS